MPTERLVIEISEKGATVVSRNVKDIGKSSQKSSKGVALLGRALGVLAAAATVKQLVGIADAFTNIQNRLRTVTKSEGELAAVTDRLFAISNKTRASFEGTAEVYSRIGIAAEELGKSQAELLDFTESLNKSVALSGASATEASAALIQLSQGLAAGALRGEELNSVLEQLPSVAGVIADELGIARGRLKEVAAEGKITADVVLNAFKNARGEIEEKFAKSVPTVGQAFQVLRNNVVRAVGEFSTASGVSTALAKGILFISENVTRLGEAFTFVEDVGRAVFEELQPLIEPLGPVFLKVGDIGKEVFKGIGLGALALVRTVAQAVDIISRLFGKLWRFLDDNFGLVFESIGSLFIDFANTAIGLVQGLIQGFITAINQVRGFLGQSLIKEFDLVQIDPGVVFAGRVLGNKLAEGLETSNLTGFVDRVIDNAQNRIATRAATPGEGPVDLTGTTGGGATPSPGQVAGQVQSSLLAGLRQEQQLLQFTNRERAVQAELLKLESEFKKKVADATQQQVDAFLGEAEGLLRTNEQFQTQQDLLEQIKGPQMELERNLAALNTLYLDGKISIDQYEKAFKSLTDSTAENVGVFEDVGATIGDSLFNNATQALGDFNSTWKDFVAGFLQDLAQIATQKALLSLFGGIGVPGFAFGGSFTVGGSGGTDSQMVSFMATPGERVDISKPGQAAPGGNGGTPSVKIINVLDPSLVSEAMGSREGEQVIMNVISRNKTTVRQAIS